MNGHARFLRREHQDAARVRHQKRAFWMCVSGKQIFDNHHVGFVFGDNFAEPDVQILQTFGKRIVSARAQIPPSSRPSALSPDEIKPYPVRSKPGSMPRIRWAPLAPVKRCTRAIVELERGDSVGDRERVRSMTAMKDR
jgi:hypothetical protein